MSSFYKFNYSSNFNNSEVNSQFTPLQTFISFIIIGYFGVKIVYSTFFSYYPDKFYDKNIEITKDDKSTILSSYAPGNWNNEFSDFVTLMILSFIIYLFTNFQSKQMIQQNGVISISFLVGYIIGLGYPIVKKSYSGADDQKFGTYVSGIALAICAIAAIYANYSNSSSQSSSDISIYLVTLFILLYGLYLTRKKSSTTLQTKVFKTKNNKCNSATTGIVETSGEKIHFSTPFFAFIVLLLFKRDPSDSAFRLAIYFIFGLLLGIFVSATSYYGIEYFLQKTPEKVCDDIDECELKGIDHQNKSIYQLVKDYIEKIMGKKIDDGDMSGIGILEEANDILEEDYANTLNSESQLNEKVKTIFEKAFGKKFSFIGKLSFIEKVKIVTFSLIIILFAYLLFISVYNSL